MRLLICAGGTGGGVYPALTVLNELEKIRPDIKTTTLWVGGHGGMESDLVQRAGIAFKSIPAAGLHGVGLKALPKNIFQLLSGIWGAKKILKSFQPDVLFFTGGYVAVPMALAGRHYPSMLFVPDIEPGLALKSITSFASVIAVPNEESYAFFKPKTAQRVTVTGYPTNSNLTTLSKGEAKLSLGLEADLPTLLIFGGSKGALTINRALMPILPELLKNYQVIHISGTLTWDEVNQHRQTLTTEHLDRYHLYPYLHEEMAAALRSADLIISRAGASILGEYPMLATPAILVPYPFAWRYQKVNAEHLVKQNAAILLPDEEMPEKLLKMINDLFQHPAKLEVMQQSMRQLRQPQAANDLAEQLILLADQKKTVRRDAFL